MNKLKFSEKELFYERNYLEWSGFINNAETDKRLELIFSDLLSHISMKNKRFLEVGCGLGYFSHRASSLKARVTGIDVGKNLISRASKNIPGGKFLIASALAIPFRNNSFDIVLSTEVIEHTPDPRKAVEECLRVVKPGGYVVITTPNKLFKPLFDFLSTTGIRKYHGIENWLSVDDLKNTIRNSGGTLIAERHFNFISPHPVLDFLEKLPIFNFFTINQGYLVTK